MAHDLAVTVFLILSIFLFCFLVYPSNMELVACAVVGGSMVFTGLVSSEFGPQTQTASTVPTDARRACTCR